MMVSLLNSLQRRKQHVAEEKSGGLYPYFQWWKAGIRSTNLIVYKVLQWMES